MDILSLAAQLAAQAVKILPCQFSTRKLCSSYTMPIGVRVYLLIHQKEQANGRHYT
ncbi:hypothetical protein D3C72_243320 [compost metagenome]